MSTDSKVQSSGGTGRLTSMSLPPELESAAVRRLGNLAIGFAAIFGFVIILRSLIRHKQILPLEYVGLANAITASLVVMMLVLFALSRSRAPSYKTLKLGLIFEILMCFGLALEEQLIIDVWQTQPRPSFVVVILLTFPLIVPTPWPKRVITTLICATSPPIVLPASLAITGRALPDGRLIFANTIPLFVSGFFALYAARLAHQLRRDATAARQVGAYELLEELGTGSMGQVWRANHRLLARDAAVKLIRADALGDAQERARGRFEREAKATASLRSPHTVALYDYGRTDEGTYYYAMELLHGFTLEELVRTHGPLPEARTLKLIRQAAVSLAEAHSISLVHRDIKPANMFVTQAGIEFDFLKVLDFGLVKSTVYAGQDATLTQEDVTAGTPAFIAPEIVLDQALDGRSDLYSLGCVAVWLLTGQLAFDETNALKMMMAHVHQSPVLPSARTELPITPAVDGLVMRCLEKNPSDRFQTAAELVAAIDDTQNRLQTDWTQRDAERWWSLRPNNVLATG